MLKNPTYRSYILTLPITARGPPCKDLFTASLWNQADMLSFLQSLRSHTKKNKAGESEKFTTCGFSFRPKDLFLQVCVLSERDEKTDPINPIRSGLGSVGRSGFSDFWRCSKNNLRPTSLNQPMINPTFFFYDQVAWLVSCLPWVRSPHPYCDEDRTNISMGKVAWHHPQWSMEKVTTTGRLNKTQFWV